MKTVTVQYQVTDKRNKEFEHRVDMSLERARLAGSRTIGRLISMIHSHGKITAIARCVDKQAGGFNEAVDFEMIEDSLEAIVVEFPEFFSGLTLAYAQLRLQQARLGRVA